MRGRLSAVEAAEAFAARTADDIAAILGDDLVGVYLHGSLAMGSFRADGSDVDLLVVARRRMPRDVRRRFAALIVGRSGHPYPLELSALVLDDLRRWRHPAPFDFHYSETWRETVERELAAGGPSAEDRADHDLAAHVTLLRQRGRVLRGTPIDEVFPAVPHAHYLDAIRRDIEWSREHAPADYGVLNGCRTLAYLRGAGFLSKAEAGEWALRAAPPEHRPAVASALAAHRGGADDAGDRADVARFVDWVESQLPAG